MHHHHHNGTKNKYDRRPRYREENVPLWQFRDLMEEKRRNERDLEHVTRESEHLKRSLNRERERANEYMMKLREEQHEGNRMRKELDEMRNKLKDLEELEELREWKKRRVQTDKEQEEREEKQQKEALAEAERILKKRRMREVYGTSEPNKWQIFHANEVAFRKLSWDKWRERNRID
jgi:chromosome segregation ATPase